MKTHPPSEDKIDPNVSRRGSESSKEDVGVVLKVLVKKGPLEIHFLKGDPNQSGNLHYGNFGDKYFEQPPRTRITAIKPKAVVSLGSMFHVSQSLTLGDYSKLWGIDSTTPLLPSIHAHQVS